MKDVKPLKLENFLPYRLSLLSNTISSNIAAVYHDKFKLGMAEWRIMAILAEYPGISADEVCQRTQIEKSVVSRAVARLLARHFLERNIDNTDKRRSRLQLSKTGMSVYVEVMPVAKSFERKLLAALDTDEQKLLKQLLDKLTDKAMSMKNMTRSNQVLS
ncbi:MAG: MarR family transcriptional regulator [Gammaproteobacteria bacterium]|nr:MarR family transcriptional regulator [Gammaproteobacteria bacterium]